MRNRNNVRTAEVLFRPYRLGALTVPNRIVMAPLTRSRADDNGVPGALQATYYAQRADASASTLDEMPKLYR